MTAQIKLNDLKKLINATKDFSSTNESRPIFQYIRLEFSKTSVTAIAVDGYRMSVEHATCFADEEFIAYIKPRLPPGNKNDIASIELSGEFAYINVGGDAVGFRQPRGEFLDWQKALPTSETLYRIGFNGDYLLSALRAAKASTADFSKNPVILEFRTATAPIILRTGTENVKMILPIRIKQ